ncbi:MAG: DUF4199 domain-containing protein [Bacteroidales bacterium]|nr:DUF4199 domain-containing protein [Bacteroidales bacterium]MBR5724930.1 DUF4199 domain-containing protein [Bacteroidales bacterium]
MAEEKNIIWERAGKAGLVLGGVSIAYMLCTMLTARLAENGSAFLFSMLNLLLWLAKFIGCIYLMRLFMLRFSQADPSADNARVFRFGTMTALLSALLYSAFYLAYVSFIQPDFFSKSMEMLQDNPFLDSNSMSAIEEMMPKLPTISFFANLIWCWLFGTVLAAIFSRNIPPQNPFTDKQ